METYQPLYLKHRPQTLGQLVGQGTVVKTLTNAIDNDRIAHAYLFTGPRGCGKTSSARILAKSLNCEKGPTAEPCMTCTMCEEIKKGISPAVMEIDAASNNSVDDARVIIERAPLVAQGGRFKLYIIDECHMLTKEAFNALLKTIEEPPPNVIFILATTEEHKVPPTIISRCQRLMFRLVNHGELCAHLRNVADKEEIHIADEAIELIARRSGGGARDALGLLDQASLLATAESPVSIKDLLTLLGAIEEDVLLKISEGIAARDAEGVLSAVHQLLAQGREPSLVALELAKHFLNLAKGMHLASTKPASGAAAGENVSLAQTLITGSQDYIDKVIAQAKTFEGAELTQIVIELDRLEQSLRRSTQPSLALEVGLLSVCHRHDILLVKELAKKVETLEAALASGDFVTAAAPAAGRAPARPQAPPPTSPPTATPAPPPAVRPPAAPQPAPQTQQQTQQLQQEADNWASTPKAEMAKSAPDQNVGEDGDVEPPVRQVAGGNLDDDDDDDEEYVSEDRAAEDAAARARAQAPPLLQEPETVAAAAAPAPRAGGDGSSIELDEFWSNLLSDLQTRHVPSHALVSQNGFPLSMRDNELVIGVLKEHFVKMLETKVDKIAASVLALSGKQMHIKIRFTDQAPPGGGGGPKPVSPVSPVPSSPAVGTESNTNSNTKANTNSNPKSSQGGSPGAASGHQGLHGVTAAERVAERSAMSQGLPVATGQGLPVATGQGTSQLRSAPPEEKKASGDDFAVAKNSRPSAAEINRQEPEVGHNPTANQLMVKEAYRLFEGPGSRFVS